MSKMSISMKSKKTIVSGCSWTDRNYSSWQHPEMDTSWKKWDEHVGEYYNWDIVNVGKSGACNNYIIDSTLDVMYNIGYTEVERCILALSQWQRFSVANQKFVNPNLLKWPDKHNVRGNEKAVEFLNLYPFDHYFHHCRIHDILFNLYRFIDICVTKNIEVVVLQMIPGLEDFQNFNSKNDYFRLINNMLSNPYFTKIEVESNRNKNIKIMGWPFSKDMGGFHIKNLLDERIPNDEWKISKEDHHPSAEGNKEIANIFTEWYDDLN